MKVNKYLFISFAVFAVSFLAAFGYASYREAPPESVSLGKQSVAASVTDNECVSNIEEKTVRGDSLSGLIEDGTPVRALFGYYLCHDPQRNEVVLYHYAGDPNPLIKIVRAVPGDTFHLVPNGNVVWQLVVNGKALTNAQNLEYQLDDHAHRVLSLYENDYHGVVPPNAYLIMGNLADGSLDSTHFGLVSKSDILAKVEY